MASAKLVRTGAVDYITPNELVADPRALQLFETARFWVVAHGRAVDEATVVVLATFLMAAVERLVKEKHSGAYKKRLLLTVLRLAIDEATHAGAGDKARVVHVLETVVADYVDKAAALAAGRLTMHKSRGAKSAATTRS